MRAPQASVRRGRSALDGIKVVRVGWIVDPIQQVRGGAEISSDSLRRAHPRCVAIQWQAAWKQEDRPPDLFVVQNCVTFGSDLVNVLSQAPVVKCVRDYWDHAGDPVLRTWLLENANVLIFSSPGQQERFPFPVDSPTVLVPPPVYAPRYMKAAENAGERAGTCWVGRMWEPQKGIANAMAWANEHREVVDFYGDGPHKPANSQYVRYAGVLTHEEVAGVLASYERFLFLPNWYEPFGRAVVEAHFAGCELLLNDNIGAKWWIDNDPVSLLQGVAMFWQVLKQVI